jgi:chemotaxis protein methyltransferase CheR
MPNRVADALGLSPIKALTDKEFAAFQRLIHTEVGIFLSDVKRPLLVGRLTKRLRELGLGSFSAYFAVVKDDAAERQRMIDAISTNETHFFREPKHFDFLTGTVFPALAARRTGKGERRIRIWSAACSTGEEPYTLAMVLLEHFAPADGWEIEVLASDISTRVLARARDGLWPLAKSGEIPQAYLKRFMLKGVGDYEGKMKAGPEIRRVVSFFPNNLLAETYAVKGTFDAIFCRNVLIYFDTPTKLKVIEKLLAHLDPEGYLFLGHAESLVSLGGGLTRELHSVAPAIYKLGPAPSRRHR